MFTWICPTCGREVPPSQDQCPNCVALAQAPPPPPQAAAAKPQAPPPPQVFAPPPIPAYAPPPPPRAKSGGVPGWLVSILVAGGLMGAGYGAFTFLTNRPQSDASVPAAATPMATAGASKSPFAKHLEISGLRITEDASKKLKVNYVVINHSGADLPDLELTISLKAAGKEGGSPICVFKAKAPGLGPYESRDLTAVVPTKLRAYELPDWQFLRAEFEAGGPK